MCVREILVCVCVCARVCMPECKNMCEIEREKTLKERDVGIICGKIYDDLPLEA